MPHFHVVARARDGSRPLLEPRCAWWLWRHLRVTWPDALAACLMPSHLHVIVRGDSADAERRAVFFALRGLSRVSKKAGLWEPPPLPATIPGTEHLLRQARYVHLNPCRDGLVTDPLGWPWSTHRAVVGAEFRPWIDAGRLAAEIRKPRTGFVRWFHAYVSADPSVAVAGTPRPAPQAENTIPIVSLTSLRDAVLSAAPLAPRAFLRRGFVQLCHAHGFRDNAIISRVLGITPQHVWALSKGRDEAFLRAASLCLGDVRLRMGAASAPGAHLFKFGHET